MPLLETKLITEEKKQDYGRFSIEPLDKGYGHTLGNALRRVLLSSLNGTAVTEVRFEDATHEFTTISGVKEDVVEIVLNIKKMIFKMENKKPTVVTVDMKGPGVVTAGDFHCPAGIEIVNKDLEIANLADKNAKFRVQLLVDYGRGYELPESKTGELGVIYLDANYSPVQRVNYTVEDTRVGKLTDLNKLTLEIFTDGSMDTEDALRQAGAILTEQFEFVANGVPVERLAQDTEPVKKETPIQEKVIYLEELGLPTRVLNTLRKSGVENAKDVVAKGEEGLLEIKNVGPKIAVTVLKKAQQALEDLDSAEG